MAQKKTRKVNTGRSVVKYNADGSLSAESVRNGVNVFADIRDANGNVRFNVMLSAQNFVNDERGSNWLPVYYNVAIRDRRISSGNNVREYANFRTIRDARSAFDVAVALYEMKLNILAREYSADELDSMSPVWAENSFKISTK